MLRSVTTCLVMMLAGASGFAQGLVLSAQPEPVQPRGALYDVELDLTRGNDASPRDSLTLLLDWAMDSGLLVTFTDNATTVSRREAGLTVELASGPGVLPGAGTTVRVRVKRRTDRLAVLADNQPVVAALDAPMQEGVVGLAAGAVGLSCAELRVRRIGPVAFGDAFDDPPAQVEGWNFASGQWRRAIYRDPLIARDNGPAGASWLETSTEQPSLALVGGEWWEGYSVEVKVQKPPHATAGVVFYAHAPGDYCAFALAPGTGGPACQLFEVRGGVRKNIAQQPLPSATAEWWYRLRVETSGAQVRGLVNGREVLSGVVEGLCDGMPGLFGEGGPVKFDDFTAQSFRAVIDDFTGASELWRNQSGRWKVVAAGLVAYPSSSCRTWLRGGPWPEAEVQVRAAIQPSTIGGIVLREARGTELSFLVSPGRWSVRRGSQVLATGACETAGGALLRLVLRPWSISCYVGEQRVVRSFGYDSRGSEIGLVAEGNGQVLFQSFRTVASPIGPVGERLDETTCVYRAESLRGRSVSQRIGVNWHPAQGRWTELTTGTQTGVIATAAGTQAAPARLHYAEPVAGDAVVRAVLFRKPYAAAGVSVGGTNDGTTLGYLLMFDPADSKLKLFRNGRLAGESDALAMAEADFPADLRLVREGPGLVGELADKAHLLFVDPEPLAGDQVGLVAYGQAWFSEPMVGNLEAIVYPFHVPEPDWMPSQGTWNTHTGMACIPWSHWISGISDNVAFLQLQRAMWGDQLVRVRISEYSEGSEDGEHYHFPLHDVRIALCGRPGELDSGYRIELGGEGGKYARIYREGQVVAETSSEDFRIVKPPGAHCNTPREIACIVTFRGGRLSFTFNGAPCLSFDDPQPLLGGYIGLGVSGGQANFADFAAMLDATWTR